jgi:hypothetical protein
MPPKVTIDIVDVGGSFARMCREAPKIARKELGVAVQKATINVSDEMYDRAPARSEAPPHIKDAIDWKTSGLSGRAGILDGEAPSGTDASMGEVALYNEYSPNEQPFMLPAANASAKKFEAEARKALDRIESALGSGV